MYMLSIINLDPIAYVVVISVVIVCLMFVWYAMTYEDISNGKDGEEDIDLDPNSDDSDDND